MACFAVFAFAACSLNKSGAPDSKGKEPLKIICTNFASYDFVRQIVGDKAEVTMLLKPGAEAHSYEPSPKDIQAIGKSDLFVYTGGDSDEWVDGMLSSIDKSKLKTLKMMDTVKLYEEEMSEGMQEEEHEHHHDDKDHHDEDKDHHHDEDKEHHHDDKDNHDKEHHHDDKEHHHHDGEEGPEMDEHVWTSPANAIQIVKALTETISGLDKDNAQTYQKNAEAYIAKLEKLDKDFHDVIDHAKRKEIIVGDRFPFLYFAKEFGLTYYAAFPGCSTDTEANPATIAFLVDKVKEDHIPVVFHIEMSNEQMSKAIAEATGAKNELLNAADLTVLPSHFETFGLVLAEGMAMGKPAIAFSVGGTPEIVKDGETGFLVEKDNEKELYERIKQLDSDRSLLKQFSENGSRWIRSQFTNHRMVDDLEVIYHELSP